LIITVVTTFAFSQLKLDTTYEVADAIGTALMVTLMTTYAASRAKELKLSAMQKLTGQPTDAVLTQIQDQIMVQATLDGINFSFLVSTGIVFVALVLSFFIKRAKPMEEKPSEVKIKEKVVVGQ
jgi:pectin methylesterase-like acyl-CoA thioesterase